MPIRTGPLSTSTDSQATFEFLQYEEIPLYLLTQYLDEVLKILDGNAPDIPRKNDQPAIAPRDLILHVGHR